MTQSSELINHQLHSDEVLPDLIKDILSKDSECSFQAKGYSMSPFIKDGGIITIVPLRKNSLSVGDVVDFIHPENEKLIIHRIVGKRDHDYRVRGDNALETDGLIQTENILGYVKKVERNGKNMRTGLGPERFLIAFLARKGFLFCLLPPLWKIIRPLAKKWIP